MEQIPITPVEGTQPTATSEVPQGMPDLSGMSKEDLAGLLDKVNAGGKEQGIPPPTMVSPQQAIQPKGGQPDLTNVLNKFGLDAAQVQANPALQKLAQSYSEAERNLSGHFQQVSDLKKENEEIKRIAQEYDEYIRELKSSGSQANPSNSTVNKDNIAWTADQVEAFNKDPMGFMANEIKKGVQDGVQSELKKFSQKSSEDRIADNQILMAINNARQNFEGFKYLEPQIKEILDQDFIDRNPKAIEFAYQAALGKEFPKLMQTAQNKAFTEGYEKAKSEMGKQVEAGGRSSTPIGDGVYNINDLRNMSKEDLSKMINRVS